MSLFLVLKTLLLSSLSLATGVSSGGGADTCWIPAKPYLYECRLQASIGSRSWEEVIEFDNSMANLSYRANNFELALCPHNKNSREVMYAYMTVNGIRNPQTVSGAEITVPWSQRRFNLQTNLYEGASEGADESRTPLIYHVECTKRY